MSGRVLKMNSLQPMGGTSSYAVRPSDNMAGFTLIEVLVAVVILAIGLLGLANTQIFGLKSIQTSLNRTQASMLSYNMADLMRANITEARKYAGSAYITTLSPTQQSVCESVSANCSFQRMAINDLYNWQTQIAGSLPGGVGVITQSNSAYVITISWTENLDQDQNNTPDRSQFVLRFQL